MNIKNIIIYYAQWFIPSATAIYIVLHEYWNWEMLPSYIIANIIAGTVLYPVNKFVFRDRK